MAWHGECQGKAKSLGKKANVCVLETVQRNQSRAVKDGLPIKAWYQLQAKKHLKIMPGENLVLVTLCAYFQVGFKQRWFCSCMCQMKAQIPQIFIGSTYS